MSKDETVTNCNALKPTRCGCGGEARIGKIYGDAWTVECTECGLQSGCYDTEAEAVEAWNKAMGAKDINVPNKFATDTNIGNKTAKFKQDGEFLRCGKCNHIVDSGYKYCPKCGSRLDFE